MKPLAIAHRAGNDPDLLRRAVGAGVDLVELDVWRCRGRLEVRHEKTLGPVPVLWDRRPARLRPGWRPRLLLDDLAAHLGGLPATVEPLLDLKGRDAALPGEVLATMAELFPGRRYTVCSQSWPLLAGFRGRPGVRVVHSVGSERMLRDLFAGGGADAVSIDQRLLTPARVERLRSTADLVMTWTVNSSERLRTLAGWGVTGVISDDLDLLRALAAGAES